MCQLCPVRSPLHRALEDWDLRIIVFLYVARCVAFYLTTPPPPQIFSSPQFKLYFPSWPSSSKWCTPKSNIHTAENIKPSCPTTACDYPVLKEDPKTDWWSFSGIFYSTVLAVRWWERVPPFPGGSEESCKDVLQTEVPHGLFTLPLPPLFPHCTQGQAIHSLGTGVWFIPKSNPQSQGDTSTSLPILARAATL